LPCSAHAAGRFDPARRFYDHLVFGVCIVNRQIREGECVMRKLQDERVVVTGGSRGLGLGIVEALLARGAQVTVVARDPARLAEVERLGAAARPGDVTDPALMGAVIADIKPSVLILNARATPFMAPIDEQTWDAFTAVWDTDVKAGLYRIQAALKAPLVYGARVLIASSGAAIAGNPLSGGYAGAKRMLWIMAHYANGLANDRGLGIHFQVLVPQQIVGETALGHEAASAWARRRGISIEAFLAERYGATLSPRQYGEHVVTLLTDPCYATGVAYGFKGDTGITALNG
jgi:NAD(P)-dependent dehydrogenase (short-subunit alcohol dehydrogenase family)